MTTLEGRDHECDLAQPLARPAVRRRRVRRRPGLKRYVTGPLGLRYEGDRLELLPFFAFTRTHNFGVSLGMFTATSPEMRWGLVRVTGLIALVVFTWLMRERRLGDILPLGMILGGALGNIHDRYFTAS
jgi:signal peptidase II